MAKARNAVQHSPNYQKVKDYFEHGLWSLERVKKAVGKWITKEEYNEITGEEYLEE